MKLSSAGLQKHSTAGLTNASLSKNLRTFTRLSPFELKPDSMTVSDRQVFYRHLCQIKSSFSHYRHYFIDNKLYKATQVIDKQWQVTWFGCSLPLEELIAEMTQRFADHPSKLKEIFIYHKENENLGKPITSMVLIFQQFYWLTQQNQFSVEVGERVIYGVVKPAWNTERVRELFKSLPEESKVHYVKEAQKVADILHDQEKDEQLFLDQPRKQHKPDLPPEGSVIASGIAPSLSSLIQSQLKEQLGSIEKHLTERVSLMEEVLLAKIHEMIKSEKGEKQAKSRSRSAKKEEENPQSKGSE